MFVFTSLDLVNIQTGGPGIVVEIDQLKLWKNKHHTWHPVSNIWALGCVDQTRERRLFFIEFLHKTANSLISVITTHVLEWSIIITDCFRSYRNIDSAYHHFTVNHSQRFVNQEWEYIQIL
ncbi:hypothetical protein RF11_08690 [Thelohanellus kitauei]|uniref:Uncharacterized protein n=1 Tax=Thelohanellus kitauei TaxID=669202 RepID=A0A0C2MWN7_THEKT|nr:hypothetical protein RF11_08690 [Thelohanellus kitauei]